MRNYIALLLLALPPLVLFDGKSFSGWEGDTAHTWRIEEQSITGGSLTETVPHNYFLATDKTFGNFILRLRFKLKGTGFVNAGIQFRSQRTAKPDYEMTGYQADLGKGYWGSLYDESRRNKTLAAPDTALISRILHPDGWNDYEIRCEGPRIRIRLNGHETVDYAETDPSIPRNGRIALQIHGGGKAQVWYKDLVLEPLP